MASPCPFCAIACAAALAADLPDVNLITSKGAATQTVRHLHLHLVPRRIGDGVAELDRVRATHPSEYPIT